ncbi:hypothetical protein ALP8811_02292 [Aliiroseovarius pelagivivens]|uniref:Uncharacterized protein n=1 Tax=Aliiroseovarius pelagivivens TaxID=1639690 RepID=A0A2R8AN10_9RHOB|nr:hypothetical protein ALP8811_02292 [Aliiroseovarius pelagivivens]
MDLGAPETGLTDQAAVRVRHLPDSGERNKFTTCPLQRALVTIHKGSF